MKTQTRKNLTAISRILLKYVIAPVIQSFILFLLVVAIAYLIEGCSTTKKNVNKSSLSVKQTEAVKKDSVAVKTVDSISIKFLAKIDELTGDSCYHTVTRIEEKIKVVNDTTKEIQRTTFIDAKGKTFRHMVKRASGSQATKVNKVDSVKTSVKKNSTLNVEAKTTVKDVKRTGFSWSFKFIAIGLILAGFIIWYFFPAFYSRLIKWFLMIFKRRRNEGNN